MHKTADGLAALVAALALVAVPCVTSAADTRQAAKPETSAGPASRKELDRGRYMMIVGSCNEHIGPVGEAARPGLPPNQEPKPPYVQWPAPPK